MLVVCMFIPEKLANTTIRAAIFLVSRELIYQQITRHFDTSLYIKSHLDLNKTL